MPHFYRYRGDDPEFRAKSRTPAPTTVVTTPSARTDQAHIRCLGVGAEICTPLGDDKNKVNLNVLFYELDKTLQGLKDENKQLRAEVEYLKDLTRSVKPALPLSTPQPSSPPAPVVVQAPPPPTVDTKGLEDRLNSKLADLGDRVGQLETKAEACDTKISASASQSQSELASLSSSLAALQAKQDENRIELSQAISSIPPTTTIVEKLEPVVAAPLAAEQVLAAHPPTPADQPPADFSQLQEKLDAGLESMRSFCSSPFSVLFDAVRSEEWTGQDSFLPYTKLNVNLGNGLVLETGKFTAPVAGLYYFSLNVYGAPRDAVVLSIKMNDFVELSSCSGVGKASQACIVDLDQNDTVGVYVNEKSKLVDTNNNKFTHFIGMLIRPDTLRFN